MKHAIILALVLMACRSGTPSSSGSVVDHRGSALPPGSSIGRGDASPAVASPQPPEGVILPTVGTLRQVRIPSKNEPSIWEGHYEVDPEDPRVKEIVERDAKSRSPWLPPTDPGDAGVWLYEHQVEAAGIYPTAMGPDALFSYLIQSGKFSVDVGSDSEHGGGSNEFTISVDIPGG